MATIRKQIDLDMGPDQVWDVVRDVGAVHKRFAPGFVTDTVLEPGARLVSFANGRTAREVIVSVDEQLQRIAYSIANPQLTHHNASFEVVALSAGRTRLIWTTDVLPDSATATFAPMIDDGSQAIARALRGKDS